MTSGWRSTSRTVRTGRILCALLERPDLQATDPDTAAVLETQLSEVLGEWVSQCSAYTAMHHLQRAGLAAGVVQDMEDLWRDPQLRARDLFDEVWQQDLGGVTYTGSAQRWTKSPGARPPTRRPAWESTRGTSCGGGSPRRTKSSIPWRIPEPFSRRTDGVPGSDRAVST